MAAGDRRASATSTDAEPAYAEADIVHAEELSFWFAADAARRKDRHGYKLVQTVWETLPFLRAYRNRHARRLPRRGARRHRPVPARDRARPRGAAARGRRPRSGSWCARRGSTSTRFARPRRERAGRARDPVAGPARLGEGPPGRAARAWRCSLATATRPARADRRAAGPRRRGCASTPTSWDWRDGVEIGAGRLRRDARGVRLGLVHGAGEPPERRAQLHPFDLPRAFWEEQFGMVLAEAMAAGPRHPRDGDGAIPEVLAGPGHAVRAGRLARPRPGAWPRGPWPARPASASTIPTSWCAATRPPRWRSGSPRLRPRARRLAPTRRARARRRIAARRRAPRRTRGARARAPRRASRPLAPVERSSASSAAAIADSSSGST